MLKIAKTEFYKLKRYSVVWIGVATMLTVVLLTRFMATASDGAVHTLEYFSNSVIWNNFSLIFPATITLIAGYIIERERVDDTLKNILTIPIPFRKLLAGKLIAVGGLAIILAAIEFVFTMIIFFISRFPGFSFAGMILALVRMIGMNLFVYVAVLPIIVFTGQRAGSFMAGVGFSFLEAVAGLHEIPAGAFNIRSNGKSVERRTTEHIDIISKEDGSGIDIIVKPEVRGESVHIPVIISQSGLSEAVYNDFHIGENADVTIIAGCGIHNGGTKASQHDGIHRFFIAPGAKVRYIEKHYGSGDGMGKRIMNPQTIVHIAENGYMEMETAQIKGVDSTERLTTANLAAGATLVVTERLLTHGCQSAKSTFEVALNGEGSGTHIISRSVAKEHSKQLFISRVSGNAPCSGHTECDAIIMDEASVRAVPEIAANCMDAALIHEAAIGKIAGEQIVKLMTLGLTEQQAEEQIISGFLK